ncbi:MAG: hypothetical protein JXJ22_10960 [Bacteroidales bacterium]|nr:hypothetical protein [Bacteroidales bacterium]
METQIIVTRGIKTMYWHKINKIRVLLKNDLKNIFRDRSLGFMFFVPLIFIALLRYLVPYITTFLPVLTDYYLIIVGVFCAITATFPAYLISFVMMDERDENVLAVFKVMPVSPALFILYRTAFITVFAFLFSLVLILFSGIIHIPIWQAILLSMLYSLLAPFVALVVLSFARNKIEGATLFKGLSFIVALPVAGIFIDSGWRYLLGIIPLYWTYESVMNFSNIPYFFMCFISSLVLHIIILFLTFRLFRSRVF